MVDETSSCPVCGKSGRAVDTATVKALLAVSLRQVRSIPYRFCATADCDVVYFSDDRAQTFTQGQVRERVYQKAPGDDAVLICYCFQHSVGAVRQSVSQDAQAAVIDDITAGIQAGQCACDWRNPQGQCCLGNVRRLIKALAQRRA